MPLTHQPPAFGRARPSARSQSSARHWSALIAAMSRSRHMPNLPSVDGVPFMLSQAKLVSCIEEHEAQLQSLVKRGLRFDRIGGLIPSEAPR